MNRFEMKLPNERTTDTHPQHGEHVLVRLSDNTIQYVEWRDKDDDGKVLPTEEVDETYYPPSDSAIGPDGTKYEVRGWCTIDDYIKSYSLVEFQALTVLMGLRLN